MNSTASGKESESERALSGTSSDELFRDGRSLDDPIKTLIGRNYRILRPIDPVTADHAPGRVSIFVTADGRTIQDIKIEK